VPVCGKHDLLIQVYAAGFCHSDLQVLQGQFPAKLPMIPSHEPAGKVVQVGSEVQGNWKVGDRVGVLNFKNACRQCVGCRQNIRRSPGSRDPRFCEERQMAGFKHDGAFAEYMLAPLMCAGVRAHLVPYSALC
jgi:D-arabinose 1-dehydrogenase-like Zn-dependent alcohol dehydrogenase